jgi:hypothetical protein
MRDATRRASRQSRTKHFVVAALRPRLLVARSLRNLQRGGAQLAQRITQRSRIAVRGLRQA